MHRHRAVFLRLPIGETPHVERCKSPACLHQRGHARHHAGWQLERADPYQQWPDAYLQLGREQRNRLHPDVTGLSPDHRGRGRRYRNQVALRRAGRVHGLLLRQGLGRQRPDPGRRSNHVLGCVLRHRHRHLGHCPRRASRHHELRFSRRQRGYGHHDHGRALVG
ncbi:hypothetical protein D3C79_821580 [compost metagenome]